MELILIVLTSAIISGLLFFVYKLGYKEGMNSKEDNSIVINEKNKDAIKDIQSWLRYNGGGDADND